MAFSTICRARVQVRETRSECLQGYAWLEEYLISRNNFNNFYFNYLQSTWPSTLDGVDCFARICNIMHAWSVISRNNFYLQSTWPSTWAGVGGGRWAASWWRADRLCNFYRPDPAAQLECRQTKHQAGRCKYNKTTSSRWLKPGWWTFLGKQGGGVCVCGLLAGRDKICKAGRASSPPAGHCSQPLLKDRPDFLQIGLSNTPRMDTCLTLREYPSGQRPRQ